jgi:hypothetical protein
MDEIISIPPFYTTITDGAKIMHDKLFFISNEQILFFHEGLQ